MMLIDTILIWRLWARAKVATDTGVTFTTVIDIPKGLHLYTRVAYSWWVIAFIAGAIISINLAK
jgi:hypothetical protein